MFEIYSNKNIEVSSQTIEGGDFTGYMMAWDLKIGFVRAAKFINNQVVEIGDAEFSNDISLTSRAPIEAPCVYSGGDGGCDKGGGKAIELREVVVTGPSTGSPVVYIPRDAVTGGISTGGFTSPGAGGANSGSSTVDLPPSCESFNFTSKKGANWQEAVVKNIYFRIIIIDNKGIYVNHVVSFPQGVLFGMPINLSKGNGDISGGVAATVSAMVLNRVMNAIDKKYARTSVSDLILTTEFKSLLTSEYRTYTNGGTVNFNSTSSLPAANYKTNPNQTGICD